MRIFITGINGFVGSYIARLYHDEGHDVWGSTQPNTGNECLGDICGELHLIETEIVDPRSIGNAVHKAKPDRIFHLAAQSHVPSSWADPMGTFRVNVEGTYNLLNSATGLNRLPRILFISSGDVYGAAVGSRGKLKESIPPAPLNPYAASKASAETVAMFMYAAKKLPVVIVRPFNHIGPGQNPAFVTSDFALQVARIDAGLQKPVIKVGDITAHKDFTDVRDMVKAYAAAIEICPAGGIFNICSGKTYSIKEILDILLDISGVKARIVQDKKRLRITGSPNFRVDAGAFRKITGWKPEIGFKKTIGDIFNYWKDRVSKM